MRDALVEAAGQILRERGLEELTLRECARRAGVSHGAPAHHFKDVSGLLAEVAGFGFESLAASMREKQAHAGASAMRKLRAAGIAYIEFAVAHRALFQLMFRSDRVNTGSERLRAAARATFALLESSLNAATRGEVQKEDAEVNVTRALLAWSVVHGFATLLLEGQLTRFHAERGMQRFARDMGEEILSLLRSALKVP